MFKSLDFIILSLATEIIPFLGFFPYIHILFSYRLPFFIYPWGNFDGVHYLKIAQNGYSQFEQAFFPLYPVLIRLIRQIGFIKNELLIGILISNLSFFFGLYVFKKYLDLSLHKRSTGVETEGLPTARSGTFGRALARGKSRQAPYLWVIIFLLTFPSSFFFGAVYTEGLFFLLVVLTLYFLKKEKIVSAAITIFLASLTRFVGVFLIIPIIFKLIAQKSKVHDLLSKILLFASPILGLSAYCFYLLKTTGDPFYFLNSQPAFGAQRSTHLIFFPQVIYRYLKIFLTANHNFQYYVAIFEFLIFFLVFIVLIWDLVRKVKAKIPVLNDLGCPAKRGGPTGVKNVVSSFHDMGLNLFSLTNLLLPTVTGTFSSIPRYALLSLSFFIFLGQIRNAYLKIFIALIFFLLHILSLGFFIQGYFVS